MASATEREALKMARFILTSDVAGQPERGCYGLWPRGTTVADTETNAQPGDLVWPQLMKEPSHRMMAPLDEAAAAMMPGSKIVTVPWLNSNPPLQRDAIAGPIGDKL
jgi:hypothetical protein